MMILGYINMRLPILMSIFAIFMISLWMIDISSSAMFLGLKIDNIFWKGMDPNSSYHLGLLLAFLCFFFLALELSAYESVKSKSKQHHNRNPD